MKQLKAYRSFKDLFAKLLIAAVLALAGLINTLGPVDKVSAAALTSKSDTLSTSEPGADANHTILFVTPTGAGDTSDTITVTFDSSPGFSLTGVTEDDIDIAYDDDNACDGSFTDITTAASADATNWGVGISGQVVTFTHSTDGANQDIPADRCVQIEIGTNATASGTGANQINNPSKVAAAGTADIMTVDIAGTFGDTGSMLVATIEGVDVSVSVAESLTFTMAGVASGSCTGDTGTPTVVDTSSSATTVPFGTVSSSNAFFTACQLLSVSTNATNGYILTGSEDSSLLSGTDTIDDTTCDSSCSESTGDTWATATNNGFGYFCEEVTNTPCLDAGDSTSEYRQFACTGADGVCDPGTGGETAQNIMNATGSADNDQGRIHYKLSIGATQPAGTYENTVTYIATPTF